LSTLKCNQIEAKKDEFYIPFILSTGAKRNLMQLIDFPATLKMKIPPDNKDLVKVVSVQKLLKIKLRILSFS